MDAPVSALASLLPPASSPSPFPPPSLSSIRAKCRTPLLWPSEPPRHLQEIRQHRRAPTPNNCVTVRLSSPRGFPLHQFGEYSTEEPRGPLLLQVRQNCLHRRRVYSSELELNSCLCELPLGTLYLSPSLTYFLFFLRSLPPWASPCRRQLASPVLSGPPQPPPSAQDRWPQATIRPPLTTHGHTATALGFTSASPFRFSHVQQPLSNLPPALSLDSILDRATFGCSSEFVLCMNVFCQVRGQVSE